MNLAAEGEVAPSQHDQQNSEAGNRLHVLGIAPLLEIGKSGVAIAKCGIGWGKAGGRPDGGGVKLAKMPLFCRNALVHGADDHFHMDLVMS